MILGQSLPMPQHYLLIMVMVRQFRGTIKNNSIKGRLGLTAVTDLVVDNNIISDNQGWGIQGGSWSGGRPF